MPIDKELDLNQYIQKLCYLKEQTCSKIQIKDYVAGKISDLSDAIDLKLSGKSDTDHNHTKDDVTDLADVTDSSSGLMTPELLRKLAGIDSEANKTIVDNHLDSNSTNPVQNKVICEEFYDKDDIIYLLNNIETGHGKLLTIYLDEDTGDLVVDDDGFEYYTRDESETMFNINVENQATPESGCIATYVIKQNGQVKGAKINIPKDMLLRSTTVKVCTVANDPVQGYRVGDKYVDFEVNTTDSSSPQHMYLLSTDLGSIYYADEVTVTLDQNNVFSIKSVPVSKITGLHAVATSGNYTDLTGTPDLSTKVDKVTGKGLSTNDYTTLEKTKLAGIDSEANKTIVDNHLDSNSTNPVTNSAITSSLYANYAAISCISISEMIEDMDEYFEDYYNNPTEEVFIECCNLLSVDITNIDEALKFCAMLLSENGVHYNNLFIITGGFLTESYMLLQLGTDEMIHLREYESQLAEKVDKTEYITSTVTFEDDTTKTYKIYAEEVTSAGG